MVFILHFHTLYEYIKMQNEDNYYLLIENITLLQIYTIHYVKHIKFYQLIEN